MGKNLSSASKKSLGSKLKTGFRKFKKYWNKPPQGRYLSFKEAFAYCVGGMGVVGATVVPTFVTLALGVNYAAALNINVDDIALVGIIANIVTIAKAPIYGLIIDNTRTKFGKFRPYMMWTPIPIVICFFAFGFLDNISNYTAMLIAYIIIFNVMQFFMGLYGLAFNSLLQVISPSQSEKEWLMGFGAFVYSLGPSIVNFIIPTIGNLLFTIKDSEGVPIVMGINTIGPYRWFVPLVIILFFALGYLATFGTKERIVQPKSYKQRIGLIKGVKNVSKNKYFWITTISGVLCVFKMVGSSYVAILADRMIMKSWANGVFTTILGMAYTPGMLLAPILIKKFGKKNLNIFSNIAVVIATIPVILACINPQAFTPYIIIALSFIIILFNSVQTVTTPGLTTQIYDYQQYKTGERLEGFISQYGAIITSLIGIGTAFVMPAINKHFGYIDDATVLSKPDILYPIIMTSCYVGIASGVLGTIPFFFWNMTEKRHANIIEILKVRALNGDNKLDNETAFALEKQIENGDSDALSNYILSHPFDNDEDFISIKGLDSDNTAEEVTSTTLEDVADANPVADENKEE